MTEAYILPTTETAMQDKLNARSGQVSFIGEHNNKGTAEIDCSAMDLKQRIGRSHTHEPSPRLGPLDYSRNSGV